MFPAHLEFGAGINMLRLTLVAWLLAVCSCTHTTVTREETVTVPPSREYPVNFFLWTFVPGLRRLPPENVMCPEGRIETLDFGGDALDAWVTILTLGVYVQETVKVGCSQKNVQKN